jgi:hypothetical protein
MELNKMNKNELLTECKNLGITKVSSKNKTQLIELINASKTNNTTKKKIVIEEDNSQEVSDNNLLSILNKLLENSSIKVLSEKLNLAPGTLTRWIELNDIPKSYEFDLLKMSGIKIDYSKYSSKQKDQFFTPVKTAQYCFEKFCEKIKDFGETEKDFVFIEPSAGDGSFLKVLPNDRTIAMDIESTSSTILEQDYLDWNPPLEKSIFEKNGVKKFQVEPNFAKGGVVGESCFPTRYVVFGNPPFGLRGHLALRFINHSNNFNAEYVCFILPQLFESDGKGVPRKRVKGFNLIYSEKLETNFYEPNKNELTINTIFQIWSKHHINDEYNIQNFTTENMRVYSMSDGGTVSSTRNKDMIGKCDVYLPSTCFGKENMKCYNSFNDLPGKKGYGIVFNNNKEEMLQKFLSIDWKNIAFLSTNSAYNLRSSQIYTLFN